MKVQEVSSFEVCKLDGAEVHDEDTVFPMTIACAAQVSALRELIAGILGEGQYPVPPRLLTLYVARKNNGVWLEDGDHVKGFLRGSIDSQYKMLSSWRLNDAKLFGLNAYLGEKVIHVLVERPTTESQDCGGVMGPFRVGAAASASCPTQFDGTLASGAKQDYTRRNRLDARRKPKRAGGYAEVTRRVDCEDAQVGYNTS